MKKILGLLFLLLPLTLLSQTVGELRYDTLKILKKGGNAELVLMNSTRDSTGVLVNVGGGKTRFMKSKIIGDTLIVIGVDTLKISPGQSVAGSDKQVQFNDGGALGAEAGFEYDKEENKFKADTLESSRVNVYTGTNKVILDNGGINISNALEGGADDNVINVNTDYNSFKRYSITNLSNGSGAGAGGLYINDIGTYLQFYVGSSANAFVPNGVLFRSSGNGGLNLMSDSGPIAFGKNSTIGHSSEFGRFTTEGRLGIRTQTPQQALHVHGQVKIDTIPNDSSPDSLMTIVNGVPHKVALDSIIDSGTYTPTLSAGTNVISATDGFCTYIFNKGIVTIFGSFHASVTAGSLESSVSVTIPPGLTPNYITVLGYGSGTSADDSVGSVSVFGIDDSVFAVGFYCRDNTDKIINFSLQYAYAP